MERINGIQSLIDYLPLGVGVETDQIRMESDTNVTFNHFFVGCEYPQI